MSEPAPSPAPGRAGSFRADGEVQDLDVSTALARGLRFDGGPRQALFTEGAIAAALALRELGLGGFPVAFLARIVRTGGLPAALGLPEPLIGPEPTGLARDWMYAAAASAQDLSPLARLERERLFAAWLDAVAALVDSAGRGREVSSP
jgi:hypothetical protein